MTKNEFVSILRGRITGSIPKAEVESQIDYYSAYIDGRIGAGLTEKEAIAELGDPQLIAKTIIESTDRAAEAAGYEGPYRSSTDSYDDSEFIYSGTQEEAGDRTRSKEKGDQENRKSGTGCTVAVVMLILALLIAWTLTSFVFRLGIHLLGWLFPLLAVIAIFALIIRIFRRR